VLLGYECYATRLRFFGFCTYQNQILTRLDACGKADDSRAKTQQMNVRFFPKGLSVLAVAIN
jgi:hypothetical protein